MKLLPQWVLAIALPLSLAACAANDDVMEKENIWKAKLQKFEPIGKTRQELYKWQNENGIPLNSFPYKQGIILGSFEGDGDGIVCSKWHIYLNVEFDSSEVINNYSVTSVGTCL